ncbi:hypothetical protein HAZT_HAZT008462 [Hyalella azteca]|uniref:EGF-like domain-containing protein n=1 Tax=Hyalella azteca TaxID=294128 RepID=A0A6A0H4B4_HYAAZ|nr:hypothetical protein HAZT_HAZT008462 [Hyalella azteca]
MLKRQLLSLNLHLNEKLEVTETNQRGNEIDTDGSLDYSLPVSFPTTLFNSVLFAQTTTEVNTERNKLVNDKLDNDKLLNNFEEFLETLTSESPETSTQVESTTTPSATTKKQGGFRFTNSPSTTTERYTNDPSSATASPSEEFSSAPSTESLHNLFRVDEEENMISDGENYNALEDVGILDGDENDTVVSHSVTSIPDFISAIAEATNDSFDQDSVESSTDSPVFGGEAPVENDSESITSTETPPAIEQEDVHSNVITREGKNIAFDGGAIGSNLELWGPNKNLATRTMSNGVRVIVAGEQTSPLPPHPEGGAPVTLPPSTLSGQVSLRASADPSQPGLGVTAPDDVTYELGYRNGSLVSLTVLGDELQVPLLRAYQGVIIQRLKMAGFNLTEIKVIQRGNEMLKGEESLDMFENGFKWYEDMNPHTPHVTANVENDENLSSLSVNPHPSYLSSNPNTSTGSMKFSSDHTSGPASPPSVVQKLVYVLDNYDQIPSPIGAQMVASVPEASLQTLTYYTTLTHLSTVSPGDGDLLGATPLVVTSRETISRLVTSSVPFSGNFIEMTQVVLNTETYLTTQTFTRTLEGETTATTSTEVLTQVIITEEPSVTRQSVTSAPSVSPMVVTKTYLTTFTYYHTEVSSDVTNVQTDTVVSSEVVTETMFVTPEPVLHGSEITKTPAPSLELESDDIVYATRTFFTTSTHLTTLLEGGSTVTTSSVTVQSRIVTETIPASNLIGLGGGEVMMPTKIIEDVPRTEVYMPLGNDVFKQLRTFFATYTHYTTLADGSVNSREVTKTKVLSSIITTTEVPQSLIVKSTALVDTADVEEDSTGTIVPTSITTALLSSSGAQRPSISPSLDSSISAFPKETAGKPGRTSTRGGQGRPSQSGSRSSIKPTSTAGLSPSQLSALKASIVTSQRSPGASVVQLDPSELFSLHESSDTSIAPEATALLDSENESSTKIVSDSTTLATVQQSSSGEIDDLSSHNLISTSVLSVPTVLRGVDGASSTVDAGGTVAVVERDGQRTVLPAVPSVLRLNTPSQVNIAVPVPSNDANVAVAETNSNNDDVTGISIGSGAAFGLMVPVLSAMAGIIKNNLPAAGVAAIAKSDEGGEVLDLPRNTLIHMQEPHFIPVGGVAASMSSLRRQSVQPTQGFIPLNRFDGQDGRNPHQASAIPFPRPINEVGGSSRGGVINFNSPENDFHFQQMGGFKPPSTTERGFTAIFTTGLIPTHVSVISGVETILFGDGLPKPLPPPGLPAPPGGEFQLIEPSFEEFAESNRVLQPVLPDANFVPFATTELPAEINFRIDSSPSRRFHNAIPTNTRPIADGKVFIDTRANGKPKGSLFSTKVIEAIALDKSSQFLMTPEILLHSTVGVGSPLDLSDDGPLVVDNKRTTVVDGVSTVMSGATTIFGTLFSRPLATNTPLGGKMTSIISGRDEHDTPEVENHKEASLSLAEENEISRFVDSSSPDQQVSVGVPAMPVSECKPRCSDVKNEVCKKSTNETYGCLCRPGYSRSNSLNPCTPSIAYKMSVLLDSISEDQLVFDPILHNLTHPVTQDLVQITTHGINKAFLSSNVSNHVNQVTVLKFTPVKYATLPVHARLVDGGVVAEMKVDVGGEEVMTAGGVGAALKVLEPLALKRALTASLKRSNYSLGGTAVHASPYAAVLASTDYDECAGGDHDCHVNALCVNMAGGFTCVCSDSFVDVGDAPGRQCVERTQQCAHCSYRGECQRDDGGELTCECQPWFSGATCSINLRVLLVAVVSCAAAAVLLLLLCCCFCSLSRRRNRREAAANQLLIPRVKGPTQKRASAQDVPADPVVPQAALLDILEAPGTGTGSKGPGQGQGTESGPRDRD